MTTLHPDLLRACAAYLAHADAYLAGGDGETVLDLLRADAFERWKQDNNPNEHLFPEQDAACDVLTRAHIGAIRSHAQRFEARLENEVDARDIAHAILDATPAMLAWWCERLGGE